MRHAVIGAGFGARVHLPAFAALPGVAVVALADGGSGRASALAYPGVAVYSDWMRLLDEVRPDSLSIATPPAAQTAIVAAAVERGIHVLCEKPVGLSPAETSALAGQAAAASVVAAVSYQFRFESGMAALRRYAHAAELGRLRRIDFSWITSGRADPTRPWGWQHDAAAGGGVINSFLPHAADLLYWHCRVEALAASAHTSILLDRRTDAVGELHVVTAEDAVDVVCELTGGAIANMRITNCQTGGDGMHIDLHGEGGMLRYQHQPPFSSGATLSLDLGHGRNELVTEDAVEIDSDSRQLPMRRLAGLFVQAVCGGDAADLPSFHDALRSQRLLAAVRASAASGAKVALS